MEKNNSHFPVFSPLIRLYCILCLLINNQRVIISTLTFASFHVSKVNVLKEKRSNDREFKTNLFLTNLIN